MKERRVNKVYCCGLGLDYGVGHTAEDAAKEGFDTTIIRDATRSLDRENDAPWWVRLTAWNVKSIYSVDLYDETDNQY